MTTRRQRDPVPARFSSLQQDVSTASQDVEPEASLALEESAAPLPIDEQRKDPSPALIRRGRAPKPATTALKLTIAQNKIISKKPALRANFGRMEELREKFASVTKAMKPALKVLGEQTEGRLNNNERYHTEVPEYKTVIARLEKGRDDKIRMINAKIRRKMQSKSYETGQKLGTINTEYRVIFSIDMAKPHSLRPVIGEDVVYE